MYGCWTADCHQLIHRVAGGQNSAGVAVRDLFINNSGNMKMKLYESGAARTWGPNRRNPLGHGVARKPWT
jgi:hypothetical protein